MNKQEFIKTYYLTEDQFYGNTKINGELDLHSLTSIPEGFNPTVGGTLFLESLTSIPEGFNPTVGGSLYLNSLTSIPKGFNPTVGGSLYLSCLISIPKGFNPTVGGNLHLESLTSIPEGFNPNVGGNLYLYHLTLSGSLDLEYITTQKENNEITWDYKGWEKYTTLMYMQPDWDVTLVTTINEASSNIYKRTKVYGGNKIYINQKLLNIVKTLPFFYGSEVKLDENGLSVFKDDCGYVGKLYGRYSVYLKNYIDDDTILVFNRETLEKCNIKVINYNK